jgi:predicted O-methyltransferase YrrM
MHPILTPEEQWAAVDRYLVDLFVPPDPALDRTLETSAAGGLPSINVAPNQGKFLHLLAKIRGATRILEIGTLGGYSTIWLARALPRQGKLITLESELAHLQVAKSNIAFAGLTDRIDFFFGPAEQTLAQFVAQGHPPFDMIFIDADKPSYPFYLQWALKLCARGTLIIADNVIRNGAVIDGNSVDPKVLGVRQFNKMVAAEPRLRATAIQTVGSKGYDGFTMALVTS